HIKLAIGKRQPRGVSELEAHVVQSLLLSPLFGNGQGSCRKVDAHDFAGDGSKPHRHIPWPRSDFQYTGVSAGVDSLPGSGNALWISNGRVRRVSHGLAGKLFPDNLVVVWHVWHRFTVLWCEIR